jgi:hypothetical protein
MVSATRGHGSATASRLVLTFITTEDVLKARLKTIGVSEHRFTVEIGQHFIACLPSILLSLFPALALLLCHIGEKTNWSVYDVGGTRTQRAAWQPYFEHVNALIFLAPISAFDQALVEDRRVNRLVSLCLLCHTLEPTVV